MSKISPINWKEEFDSLPFDFLKPEQFYEFFHASPNDKVLVDAGFGNVFGSTLAEVFADKRHATTHTLEFECLNAYIAFFFPSPASDPRCWNVRSAASIYYKENLKKDV